MEKRLEEVNKNKEFADSIDYENGQECGYYEDYADEDEEVTCCMCEAPLFSRVDNGIDGDEIEEEVIESKQYPGQNRAASSRNLDNIPLEED